jgi:hypothetical protein
MARGAQPNIKVQQNPATTVYLSYPGFYLPRELFRAASGPTRHRLLVDGSATNIDFD